MKLHENDRIDRELTEAFQAQLPKGDFRQWAETHPEAIRQLRPTASAKEQHRSTIPERMFTMRRMPRIAAAILILAIAGIAAWLTIGRGGASIAWADVQEHIRNARTLTYKISIQQEGKPNLEMDVMYMDPGLMRQELYMPETGRIVKTMDLREGKLLVLLESQKQAIFVDMNKIPKSKVQKDLLARMRSLIEEAEAELGEKEIDGRPARGYRVTKDGFDLTIWADIETARPVEMELTMFSGSSKIVMMDFELDRELDPSLFSLVPADGYSVIGAMDVTDATIEDVARLLRKWAELRGGTFPDDLGIATLMEDFRKGSDPDEDLTNEEDFQAGEEVARGLMFLQTHPDSQYKYLGKGITLGDADKAVFWCKPKESETYKVIYGDLRIEDVAEEDLPTTQPAAEPEEATTMD